MLENTIPYFSLFSHYEVSNTVCQATHYAPIPLHHKSCSPNFSTDVEFITVLPKAVHHFVGGAAVK
jgi:hypothetical protein